jgi:hypothetical protein
MKTCQFCAEEIQDAAIVCKHCGRDLGQTVVTTNGAQTTAVVVQKRRKKWPWIVLGAIVLFVLVQWSRADFLEFSQRREDWHRRCDAYVGAGATMRDADKATDCQREAAELVAYAKQKGWGK